MSHHTLLQQMWDDYEALQRHLVHVACVYTALLEADVGPDNIEAARLEVVDAGRAVRKARADYRAEAGLDRAVERTIGPA